MMPIRPARYAVVLLILAPDAGAQGASAQSAAAQSALAVLHALPGSSLTIRGSTTIGAAWHCSARDIEARVAVAPASDSTRPDIPEIRGVVIHVPVSALRCQNGPMERAMRGALKVERDTAARNITGVFEIVEEFRPRDPAQPLLAGGLRVAGAERNVSLQPTIDVQADGSLHVRSVVPLQLTQFGITPPRVLFGAVRARDAVTVEVDLRYPSHRAH